jgi:osmoprotectant transport system permease protein
VLYGVLPVLRNTMVGLQHVDRRLVEAGRGMGMTATAVLFKVELPMAVPIMLSGIRMALVLLVGGLMLVALLALLIDWLGRVVEHIARPKGL